MGQVEIMLGCLVLVRELVSWAVRQWYRLLHLLCLIAVYRYLTTSKSRIGTIVQKNPIRGQFIFSRQHTTTVQGRNCPCCTSILHSWIFSTKILSIVSPHTPHTLLVFHDVYTYWSYNVIMEWSNNDNECRLSTLLWLFVIIFVERVLKLKGIVCWGWLWE